MDIESDIKYGEKLFCAFDFPDFMDEYLLNKNCDFFDPTIAHFLLEVAERSDDRGYISKVKEFFPITDNTDGYVKKYGTSGYIKLYLISLMYNYNKDNLLDFIVLVDDIMKIKFPKFLAIPFDFDLERFIESMEFIFSYKDYKYIDELRTLLKDMGNIFYNKDKLYKVHCCCLGLKELNSLLIRLNLQVSSFEVNHDSVLRAADDFIKGELGATSISNIGILLRGDRYSYFMDKLVEVEDNPRIRKHFISLLGKMSVKMFDELSSDKDSFIKYMDMVFDSDSYREFESKFMNLRFACECFDDGRKEYAFEIVKGLNDPSYKSYFMNKMVYYPQKTMNKVNKPKRIIDRMKEIYSRIDDSISYNFLDKVHSDCIDFSILNLSIDVEINKRQSFVTSAIKRKMKGLEKSVRHKKQ